jgi:RES domain-containing protein
VYVHLDNSKALTGYSMISATIPDDLIDDLEQRVLPADWNAYPAPPAVQAIGDAWLKTGAALALRVPSAVLKNGKNVLINPLHRDFARIIIDKPEEFAFDARMVRTSCSW